MNKDNQTIQDKRNEMQPPKTRYNSRDRSKEAYLTSSSRLKNFPAEKIKKLNNLPIFSPDSSNALIVQQNPWETGIFFANSPGSNNDRGDAISTQFSIINQKLKPSTVSCSNQQQANHYQQIGQANPQSDSLLTRHISSPERQAYRPFVPNIFQKTINRNQSFKNPSTMINQPIIQTLPTQNIAQAANQVLQKQQPSNSHMTIYQNRSETAAFDTEHEKQPVDNQNTINQIVTQTQQQEQMRAIQGTNAPLSNEFINNYQNIHGSLHNPFHQISRQIYQQTQRNPCYQQISQQALDHMSYAPKQQQQICNNLETCCDCNQQISMVQIAGQGMTSPQDIAISQTRLMQHNLSTHQQNLGHPINLQFSWPQNDRRMQMMNYNYLHQQPSWQSQYHYQTPNTQNSNFKKQNSDNQSQFLLLPNQKATNQQSITETHNQQQGDKKKISFTPDMIRDQEMLISTMKQQGVSDDMIHHQFDTLLNEQCRHLAYLAQFHQQKDTPENMNKSYQFAQRRIVKDGKPEWMVHITPPRLSYNDIEKLKMQHRIPKEQCLINDQSPEKLCKTTSVQQQNYYQQNKKEAVNQAIPSQQTYFPVNPYQQQMANWSYKSDHQTPCSYTDCYSNHQQNTPNNAYHQQNPAFNGYNQPQHLYKYPYNISYNPYYVYSQHQKAWCKEHNANSSSSTDNRPEDPMYIYEQRKTHIEPSSLLKMRIYKEVIRPQKRNNGLQDINNIQKTLETFKDPANRKGLEYLANLIKKKPVIRLNGTQNPDEIQENLQTLPPITTISQVQKRISMNGLNSRNPNNPPPYFLKPKRVDEPLMIEYPRQRQNPKIYHDLQAEKENGAMTTSQQQNHTVSHIQNTNSIPFNQLQKCYGNKGNILHFDDAPFNHQMQQYYLNKQNFMDRNDGQGDVVNMQQSEATPKAIRINHANGDTSEHSNVEETTKHMNNVQSMHGTNVCGQSEILDVRNAGYFTGISPDKLMASRYLQSPLIL